MTTTHTHAEAATPVAAKGAWRPWLRTRLVGRAEPLFVDTDGLRSAASVWSGAQAWAQLLRTQADSTCVVVRRIERLALLQLLVAVLWDGRTLQIGTAGPSLLSGVWCVDGREVLHAGQTLCRLGEGGWPDLAGPERLSILDMLAVAPADGDIAVHGQQATHGALWLALAAPLGQPQPAAAAVPAPGPACTEVLAPFDLAALATPHDVLNDALLPLLRCTEVWEPAAFAAQHPGSGLLAASDKPQTFTAADPSG